MTGMLTLSLPTTDLRESYLSAVHEFLAEGRKPSWNLSHLTAHFDEFVASLLARATDPLPGMLPETLFWSVVDGQFVGRVSIRHTLNEGQLRYGGHIGYEIRPSMRQRGYGKEQCRLAIIEAHALGIERILITCDDDNEGSIRIIEANGGRLADRIDTGRHVLTRRYWVE